MSDRLASVWILLQNDSKNEITIGTGILRPKRQSPPCTRE